jgi:hypothetical protein
MALAAVIEYYFVILGKTGPKHWQCPIAMDKLVKLVVAEHQLTLGLIWNTKHMTVARENI